MQTNKNRLGLREALISLGVIALGMWFFGARGCGGSEATPAYVAPARTPLEYEDYAKKARELSEGPLKKVASGQELTEKDKTDLRAAGNYFERIIDFDPKVVHPYLGAGIIFHTLDADDKAEQYFVRAVNNGNELHDEESLQSVAEAHYQLSLIQTKKRNYSQALDEADQAVKTVPTSAEYLAARAGAYVQLKDKQRALADIQAALKIDPKNRRAQGLYKLIALAG